MQRLSNYHRQLIIDKYDPDDIISILEPDIEELIDYLEPLILAKLGAFELSESSNEEPEI